LRPPVPAGAEPHLCFKINFRGEDVEGYDGPYRQFFSDITRELRTVTTAEESGEVAEDDVDLDAAEEKAGEGEETGSEVHLNLLVASRNMLPGSKA
jgi:hypothetical protein